MLAQTLFSDSVNACACRLTGRAVFFRKLLARQGHLIQVPLPVAQLDTDKLADYLLPRLQEAAGGSLDAYWQ